MKGTKLTPEQLPSIEELRRLFHYDKQTGAITRAVKLNRRLVVGSVAAREDKRYGYLILTVSKQNMRAHRVAWAIVTGSWPLGEIDHINGNRSDNRWGNLRDVPRMKNAWNRHAVLSRVGVLGVSEDKKDGGFRAQIQGNHKHYMLGTFQTIAEARAAYLGAKKILHDMDGEE